MKGGRGSLDINWEWQRRGSRAEPAKNTARRGLGTSVSLNVRFYIFLLNIPPRFVEQNLTLLFLT